MAATKNKIRTTIYNTTNKKRGDQAIGRPAIYKRDNGKMVGYLGSE